LTAAPEEEMTVAWELLRALGLRQRGPEIISCPTCGRTEIDLIGLAQEVERRLRTEKAPIKVAVMGCAVNGPGEAREADIGIAGGDGCALIFKKGQIIKKVPESEVLDSLMEEIDKL
jgi:(E)-4-hydroxy-3-methylbut-2-enyl-diphosphate synthase